MSRDYHLEPGQTWEPAAWASSLPREVVGMSFPPELVGETRVIFSCKGFVDTVPAWQFEAWIKRTGATRSRSLDARGSR